MKIRLSRSKLLYPFVILGLIIALMPFQVVSGRAPTVNSGYVVQAPYLGIWISGSELANLPTTGTAWNALKAAADKDPGVPDISNQDENNDVFVLAKALVYARTGDTKYRAAVIDNLTKAMGTEAGGRTLALARNLVSYVIAADLINLPADPSIDQTFRSWLKKTLSETLTDGRSLRQTQEERPNNWGNHAGASRAAVARYLGDQAELDRTALVFRGYLGDRAAYHNFKYGDDLSWQCDPNNLVGINPVGCVKNGHSIDGVMPDDMRRGGAFQWAPVATGYPWEGLQGVVVEAQILTRAGYPAFQWQNQAILRAVKFLYSINWPAIGDDAFQLWIINHAYGTNYPAVSPAGHGKNMGWTDWTLGSGSSSSGTAPTPVPATPIVVPTSQPTATKLPTLSPTTTVAPTAVPTQSSAALAKSITFESGNLTDAVSGVNKVHGNVTLDKTSAVSGIYSAAVASSGSAYMEENFQGCQSGFRFLCVQG